MKFQIRIPYDRGCMSFVYFEATSEEEAKTAAVEATDKHVKEMNDRVTKAREDTDSLTPGLGSLLYQAPKIARVLRVVELTGSKEDGWEPKRGGVKFKLTKQFIQYRRGRLAVREEWYTAQ